MWHQQLKSKLRSQAKAAEVLYPRWKRQARSEVSCEKTTKTALENQIGKLRQRGDATGWWRDRPVLRRLFAELLELQEHEIFQRTSGNRGAIAFREFPALPALAFDERPCHLPGGSTFDRVVDHLRSAGRYCTWLKVPPGGGKSLAIEILRTRHSSEVLAISVRSLRELLAQVDHRPLIAEVEESHRGGDREALAALQRQARTVIVLAPFESPEAPGEHARWTRQPPDGTLGKDGLERMLRWIAERLERGARAAKLRGDDVLAWIRQSDARERAIRTPGDLLALCADFSQFGADGSLPERGKRWLDAHGAAWIPADAPPMWRAGGALDAHRALVKAEALDASFALGHRPVERWAELLPERLDPGPARGAPGRDMVIGYLAQAGLLRGGEHGLEPYPGWVGRGIAQAAVQEQFKDASPARWGVLAADESRRAVVDASLDELSDRALRGVRRKALGSAHGSAERASLGSIAALEATLAASARRIADASALGAGDDPQELQQLLVEQLGHTAVTVFHGLSLPLTRRDRDEWYATGWAISLFTPRPASPIPADLTWVLPGWAPPLQLADAPSQFPWSSQDPWGASAGIQRLVRLAPRLLERLEPGRVPVDVPRVFLPALLLSPSEWHLGGRHLNGLAGSWEESFLVDEVHRRSSPERSAVARRLWRMLGDWLGGDTRAPIARRIEHLEQQHSALARLVLESVPAEDIAETARIAGVSRAGTGSLRALPPASRSAALRGWMQPGTTDGKQRESAHDLVPLLDMVDLEIVLEDLRAADRSVVWTFTPFVWRTNPGRAFDEACLALDQGRPAAECWFHTAPREHVGRLADVLATLESRPAWVGGWALHRLTDAGSAAEHLFAFARGVQADPDSKHRRTRRRSGVEG